ncbi:competence protein CoiA family protein [Nostoc sp.]
MRFAASIRYGGQLIEAIDADYEDYKRLALICPECKSGVFLRKKSERASAHFAHFKASDPALVKQCELRVSCYSQEDLERKATQARNQRLRLLQRWFWEVYFKYAFREGSINGWLWKQDFGANQARTSSR